MADDRHQIADIRWQTSSLKL